MAESEDLQSFRVGGAVGGPPLGAGSAAAEAESKPGNPPRKHGGYPSLEAILGRKQNFEAFRGQAAATTQRLQQLVASGGDDAADAQKLLVAYDLLGDMLQAGVKLTIRNLKRMAKAKALKQAKNS